MKTTKTIVAKLRLKYSPMLEVNTCIAKRNLEVLPFAEYNKGLGYSFLLKVLNNDVRSDDTARGVIALLTDDSR